MGSSSSRHAEPTTATATLFYESYGADLCWLEVAELADSETTGIVRVQLCDVATMPARAAAERVSTFPAVLCVCPWTRTRTVLTGDGTLLAELDAWIKTMNEPRAA